MNRASPEERLQAARDHFEHAIAEHLGATAFADGTEAQAADTQGRQAKLIELEQMVEERRLELLNRDRQHRDRLTVLETALAAAHAAQSAAAGGREEHATREGLEALEQSVHASAAEQARLQALIAESEAARTRIAAEYLAALGALEELLARTRQDAAVGREQSRQALAELRAQLAEKAAGQSRATGRAEELEKERDHIRAEHQQELAGLETLRLALADVRTQLAQASAEHGRLVARVEEYECERERLIGVHQQALAEAEAGKREALSELRAHLAQVAAEQSRAAGRAEELENERDLLRAGHQRAVTDLETRNREVVAQLSASQTLLAETTAEQNRLIAAHHQAFAEAEAGKREALAELRAQLDQASAGQSRVAGRVEELEKERDLLHASQMQLANTTAEQNRLIAAQQQALGEAETSKREALTELRAQLNHASAEQNRVTGRAEELEKERDLIRAGYQRAVTDLEIRNREVVAQLHASQTQLAETTAERSRLAARVEEHERERDRLIAAQQQALGEAETSKREALAELGAQLDQASAEQGRATGRAEELEKERDVLRAGHQQAVTDLEIRNREVVAHLDASQTQLAQASAEQSRLAARVEEQRHELDRLMAAHQQALAEGEASKRDALAELRAQLSQASAEQSRLAAGVVEYERERDRLIAAHQQAFDEAETSNREAIAEFCAQLAQASAEQSRLAARVEAHERDRDRMTSEHELAIAGLEASTREALAEVRSQLSQAGTDNRLLIARAEEHQRERDRLIAAHQQALAEIEASKRAERENLASLQGGLGEPFKVESDELPHWSPWTAETFDATAATVADREDITDVLWVTPAVAETPAQASEAESMQALFDSADDMFVRHLLAGTDERASLAPPTDPQDGSADAWTIDEAAALAPGPEHETDGRVAPAQAVSETQAEPIGVEPHALFDGKDDWFVRHLFEGTGDSLPVDTANPPSESVHVQSDTPIAPSAEGRSPEAFDSEDDTFVHHLFRPEDS